MHRIETWLAITLISAFANSTLGAPIIWPSNGHAYDRIDLVLTWHDALAAAAGLTPPSGFATGRLATISDAAENEFLRANFAAGIAQPTQGPIAAWLGMTDELIEGEWRWIDDTLGIWQDPDNFVSPIQTAFDNWHVTGNGVEPNNSGGIEHYLSMKVDGFWNDTGSSSPDRMQGSFLVEWGQVPEPTTFMLAVIGSLGLVRLRMPTKEPLTVKEGKV